MTQKEKCKTYCKEYLQSLSLTHIFDETEFERIYRKGGSQANAYTFGLSCADRLIFYANYKTTISTN
jgi:hypothetical protein